MAKIGASASVEYTYHPASQVPLASAGPSRDAYVQGSETLPGTSPATTTVSSVDLRAGSTLTLHAGDQLAATNGISISPGATLKGTGTLTGDVYSAGAYQVSLAGHTAGTYDQLQVNGNLSLLSTASLSVAPQPGFAVAQGDLFNIVNIQGNLNRTFAGLPEGATVPVGSSNLTISYTAGSGNDIALFSPLTTGSVSLDKAGPTDVAYLVGTRVPTGNGPSLIALKGLDLLSGSAYTLGPNETLNLDNSNGLLNVLHGATFTGNGIIQGNVHNEGLVRIPIVALSQVTGGNVIIPAPTPIPGNPPPVISRPTPGIVPINPGTRVEIGGSATGGGGGFGGGSVGGGSVQPPPIQVVDPCVGQTSGCGIVTQGVHAVDASLEVTGYYEQTATGITRMFVGGNDAADFGPGRNGGTYSQLFVRDRISLDGTVQIVLQPELFDDFAYNPHVGDTFDFFISDAGIDWMQGLEFDLFVTVDGAGLLNWLNTSPYSSGIASDPDHLLQVSNHLFDFSLINQNNQYILRGTLVAWDTPAGPSGQAPEPSILWLMVSGLTGFAWRNTRRQALT